MSDTQSFNKLEFLISRNKNLSSNSQHLYYILDIENYINLLTKSNQSDQVNKSQLEMKKDESNESTLERKILIEEKDNELEVEVEVCEENNNIKIPKRRRKNK